MAFLCALLSCGRGEPAAETHEAALGVVTRAQALLVTARDRPDAEERAIRKDIESLSFDVEIVAAASVSVERASPRRRTRV